MRPANRLRPADLALLLGGTGLELVTITAGELLREEPEHLALLRPVAAG